MMGAQKGHTVLAETREKISRANKGRIHTPGSRRNMSVAHLGIKRTESANMKTSISLGGTGVLVTSFGKVLRDHYGITESKFYAQLAKQNGVCAIST